MKQALECPLCGAEIGSEERYCPECGETLIQK
ncbi:zinc-ribbon domain-containing protein [Candidatus Woesearchaeota archaeon]|nr:zinc-ribbon domain-containing protein [Candidatus Woesearchaeota archaeon]